MTPRLVYRRALLISTLVSAVIAVVGGVIGGAIAGWPGVASALIGAALSLVYSALTIVSLMIASRLNQVFFFAVVMGAWILKLLLFVILIALLGNASFVVGGVLFCSLIAAALGGLAVDVTVALTTRVPYVDVRLPGDADGERAGSKPPAA